MILLSLYHQQIQSYKTTKIFGCKDNKNANKNNMFNKVKNQNWINKPQAECNNL